MSKLTLSEKFTGIMATAAILSIFVGLWQINLILNPPSKRPDIQLQTDLINNTLDFLKNEFKLFIYNGGDAPCFDLKIQSTQNVHIISRVFNFEQEYNVSLNRIEIKPIYFVNLTRACDFSVKDRCDYIGMKETVVRPQDLIVYNVIQSENNLKPIELYVSCSNIERKIVIKKQDIFS